MEVIGTSKGSKLKLILVLISCVFAFTVHFAQATRVSIHNCYDGSPVQLKDFSIDQKSNANATVSIDKLIVKEGTTAEVTVKLGMIKVLDKTFDVCEKARQLGNSQISCPISPGDYVINRSLPREMPRAKYAISVRIFDADYDELGCFHLNVDLKK